jgi:hypothetical protein
MSDKQLILMREEVHLRYSSFVSREMFAKLLPIRLIRLHTRMSKELGHLFHSGCTATDEGKIMVRNKGRLQ